MKKSTLIAEFDQAVHIVDSSFPSLYTKEDVIKVLRNLETTLKDFISDKEETYESIINITSEQYSDLASSIAHNVAKAIEDMECISGWDLSMNYNEVSVDSLEANESEIEEIIEDVINKWVIDIKEDDCDC